MTRASRCPEQEGGGHNAEENELRLHRRGLMRNRCHRRSRRRTVSLTESGEAVKVAAAGGEHHVRVPVYLSPSDILTHLQRPFRRRSPRSSLVSTADTPAAVSLPDIRVENGRLQFKCWAPSTFVRATRS